MRTLGLVAFTLIAGSTVQAQTGKQAAKQATTRAEFVGRWISVVDSVGVGDSTKIRLDLEADSTITLTVIPLSPAIDSVMQGASTRDGVGKFTGMWNLTGDTLTTNLQKAAVRTSQGWQDLPTPASGATERWRVQIEGTRIAMTSIGEVVVLKRDGAPAVSRKAARGGAAAQPYAVRLDDLVGRWVTVGDTGTSADFRADSTVTVIAPIRKDFLPPRAPTRIEPPTAIKLTGSWSLAGDTLTTVLQKGAALAPSWEDDPSPLRKVQTERKLVRLKGEQLTLTAVVRDAKIRFYERDDALAAPMNTVPAVRPGSVPASDQLASLIGTWAGGLADSSGIPLIGLADSDTLIFKADSSFAWSRTTHGQTERIMVNPQRPDDRKWKRLTSTNISWFGGPGYDYKLTDDRLFLASVQSAPQGGKAYLVFTRAHSTNSAAAGGKSPAAPIATPTPTAVQQAADSTTYATARNLFFDNQLKDALPRFEAVVRSNPGAVEPLVWYAETARRLGKLTESLAAARQALALAPCNSFAHTVMADAYYPPFSWDERTNADSAWFHANQAIQCAPDDGNAWLLLWDEAIHRKSREMEKQALRRLLEINFFSPSYIAFNRWVLESLPRDAVLVTGGDLDTYPALSLQEGKALRRDVGVVNLSMLELPWYVRHVVERYGLPMPFPSDSLDAFRSYTDSAGNSVTLSSAVFDRWRKLAAEGQLTRPFTVGFTTALLYHPTRGEYRIEGPFARVPGKGEQASELVDTAKVRVSLAHLTGASFSGPLVSPQDRSPVRRSGSSPRWVPLYLASWQGKVLVEAGAIDAAKQQLAWMERFGYEAGLDSSAVAEWVQSLKKSLP